MYKLQINELTPGQKYYVKVRAKAPGYATSEWSPAFEFEAEQDQIPPERVRNLTFTSEGDSFIARWEAPELNMDGTPCTDLSHYKITLVNFDASKTVHLETSNPEFTIDFNSNKQLFGTPSGIIEITVSAVDRVSNVGPGSSKIAQNMPPAKVNNVTAQSSIETVTLKWDPSVETDIEKYNVYVSNEGPGFAMTQATLAGSVAFGTNTFAHTTMSLSPLYFKVTAVDKFLQQSPASNVAMAQPKLTTDFDKTPPGAVTNFTAVQSLAPDNSTAIARLSFTAAADNDLDKYEVQYRKTGETTLPWSFLTIPSDQTSAEIKSLPLSTSYDFRIRAVDFLANKGDWSAVVVAPGVKKTTLPAEPTGVTVRGGMSNLMVTWNASTDPSMANWSGTYEVQISKASTFTSPTTIKTSSTLASFINLDQNTVYYARVRSLDPYGNTGTWSTTANGNTGIVADANASRVIWSATEPANGKTNDLWIKTPENVQYRFDGTNWIKAQDAELANEINNVRQTADGKNKAWYQTTKPPATNNTQGDLWFDTANGNKLHVWSATANDWVSAQDEAIQDALDDAADALQTADGKNTIYYSTPPATGLKEGDTWFDNAVIKVYKSGAWVDASTALDNAKANQAIQIAGSKNKTYYVAKASATGMIEGDVLFDSADGNKQYRYNGTTWVAVTDAAIAATQNAAGQAQQTADKKNTIYYSTPPTTGLKDGDTWFDGPTIKTYRNGVWTDSSSNLETQQGSDALQVAGSKNKTYYTTYANRPTTGLTTGDLLFDTANKYKAYRYNGSAWESVQDGTIADAKTAADNAMASANARNRNVYSTSVATGTALNGYSFIDGDTWFRKDANNTVVGMWEFVGGTWVSKTLNNQVIANLDAGKINAGTINADRIGSNSIDASKIVIGGMDGSVVIKDGTVTADELAANSVIAGKIATGAVTADKIKAGEIDATKIVQGGMDGSVVIENGTITATQIKGSTITGDKIAGNTIDATSIKAGSIVIGAPNSPLSSTGIATPSTVATAKTEAINAAASDATSKANQARIDAINAAATDAQTKADAAKTAAENAAKAYADGQISQAEADAIAAAAADAQTKADAAKQAAIQAAATDATTKANNAKSQAITEAGTAADTKVANAVGPINTKLTTWTKTGSTFIDGGQIFTDSITAGQIAANAITASELAANAVTAAKIKAGEIDSTKIVSTGLDGSTVITNGTITTEKIGANQITGAKIAANTITVGNMGPNSVDRTVIKDGEIITAKLAANAVKAGNIDAGAITAGKIAAGAITIGPTSPIAPGTIANSGEVVPKISGIEGSKVFRDLATYHQSLNGVPGALIVRTPITFNNYMTSIKLSGYNYQSNMNNIDLTVSFYASTTSGGAIIQASLNSTGLLPVEVTICKTNDTTPTVALIIKSKSNTGLWYFPKLNVDEAMISQTGAPDSFKNGWSISHNATPDTDAEILAWTKVTPSGSGALNQAETVRMAEGWAFTGTTEINGGKIKADTITALQIASKTITAEEIKGETITAAEIAADAITAAKIKADEITGDKLKANTALVKSLNIQSSLTINAAAGHIKSSNWNDTNKTGFYMDQQQLIVHNGRIEASAIKLQDSSNIMPPQFASFNSKIGAYTGLWTSGIAGITKVAGDGKFGGDSLQVVTNANGYLMLGKIGELNIPIEGGRQYIISFYVSNRASKVFTMEVGLYQSASAYVYGSALSIASTTAWTRYSVVVTAPTNMPRAVLRLNPQTAPVTFRLDGIQVEQKIGQETAPSNWSPPGFTSIDGESITTGSISSNSKITTPNGEIARWSIDTAGRARFADATIDGKLIVGADVSNKEATSIQSDTYSPGMAGWAIKGNGDVEFNDGTFRGVLNLGRLTGEDVRPTMTVSVSNIELFTDATTSRDIDVASIQGTTYAYTRTETAIDSGVYLPTTPDQAKSARYFIGPTTDRSVNIQVHDGERERAVYLDNAPDNVTLSSVKIGELTNTSSAPLEREKQGFGHVTQRAEADPASPDKTSTIKIEQDSSVRLRSASYPEISGGNEYPDSTHKLTTAVNFKAPDNKNMLSASSALPASSASYSIARESSQSYSARAYPLHNDFTRSTFMTFGILAGNRPVVGKKHVFSTYVDTNDATDPVAVYAFMGSTPLKPISGGMDSGQTEYQHSVNYNSPDYRYEFETNSASYANLGSGSAPLTRTTGSGYISPIGALYPNGNMRYTATENYSMNQGMSISMWIAPSSTSGAGQVIFHRATDTSREIWINYEPNSKTFSGGLSTGTAWTFVATNNLVGNGWAHVTFVIPPADSTSSRYMRIYINGEERWVSDAIPTNRFNLAFGTQPYYLFSNMQLNSYYSGAISEPMIFKRMLTAAQVSSIFQSGNKVVYFSGGRTTLSQNGILVSPGREERVAFEYNPTVANESPLTVQTVSTRRGVKTYIYKLQLERAKYMDNENLPDSIRSTLAPTPWTTDGSIATAGAELTLKSTPAPDQASWSIGAQTSSEIGARSNQQAADRSTASEMRLTLASSYRSSLNASTEQSVSTTYKWTSAGVSYPGMNIPYMPTVASVEWNYQDLPAASRPQIGGSSNWSTVINSSSLNGQINIGSGLPIRDRFDRSGSVGDLGPNWINTGNVKMEIVSSEVRRRNNNAAQAAGITSQWVTSAQELGSFEQEMEIDLADSSDLFTRWPVNVSVLLSLDPNTDSRVEFRYIDYDPQRVEIFVVNNGQQVWSHQSDVTGGRVNGWSKFSFIRANRTLTIKRNGNILRSISVPSNITMPEGKNVGFNVENGRLDNVSAYDRAPGASSYGLLRPESINVNNNRGIKVEANGSILVEAPGWYVVSGIIAADGTFGGNDARDYWLEVHYNNAGSGGSYALGGQHNSTAAISHISGTYLCYLQGYVSFVARSNTTTIGRISYAQFNIARVV